MDVNADSVNEYLPIQKNPSTKEKLLGILDEVEVIYNSLLELIGSLPGYSSDPNVGSLLSSMNISVSSSLSNLSSAALQENFRRSVGELVTLLAERQGEFMELVASAAKEAEIEVATQNLVVESEKLKDQIMLMFSRLKDAEQILSNALHLAKQKTENIRSTEKANLNLDDIIRYAHRISVGFSAAAPTNWKPGDPRRPYPTDVEMRAGSLARMGEIPPPINQILALPTEQLTATTHKFLASNAGPFTFSPQPAVQITVDSPKTAVASNIQREVAVDEQDVETMSSDSSSSTSSEEE